MLLMSPLMAQSKNRAPPLKTTSRTSMEPVILHLQVISMTARLVDKMVLARLRNYNATDDGNVDFRSFKKIDIQSLENKYK